MESRETVSNWPVRPPGDEVAQEEQECSVTPTVTESDEYLASEVVTPQCSVAEETTPRHSSPSPTPTARRIRSRGRTARPVAEVGGIEARIENFMRNMPQPTPNSLLDPNDVHACFCLSMYHSLKRVDMERSEEAMDSMGSYLLACQAAQRAGRPTPVFNMLPSPPPPPQFPAYQIQMYNPQPSPREHFQGAHASHQMHMYHPPPPTREPFSPQPPTIQQSYGSSRTDEPVYWELLNWRGALFC